MIFILFFCVSIICLSGFYLYLLTWGLVASLRPWVTLLICYFNVVTQNCKLPHIGVSHGFWYSGFHFWIFKIFLLFLIVCLWVDFVHTSVGDHRGQKHQMPHALVVNYLTWVLGTEHGSSWRTVCVLIHWVISQPLCFHFHLNPRIFPLSFHWPIIPSKMHCSISVFLYFYNFFCCWLVVSLYYSLIRYFSALIHAKTCFMS